MAISLNNHETRIKNLETKIGTGLSDTGWRNGTRSSTFTTQHDKDAPVVRTGAFRYRVINGIVFLDVTGVVRSAQSGSSWANLGTLPNWTYGTLYFAPNGQGTENGSYEGKCIMVNSSGVVYDYSRGSQWRLHAGGMCCCPVNS